MSFSFPNKNSNINSFPDKSSNSFEFPEKKSMRSKFFSDEFNPFQDNAPFQEEGVVIDTNWEEPNKS